MKPRTLMCIRTRTLIALLAIPIAQLIALLAIPVAATQEQTEQKQDPGYTISTKLGRADQSEAINNKEGCEKDTSVIEPDDLVTQHTGGYCRIKSPQNTMDGFCAGSVNTGLGGIQCVGKSDPPECPVGKLAKSPGIVHLCPGNSTHVDI
jgi:hypothetical protein